MPFVPGHRGGGVTDHPSLTDVLADQHHDESHAHDGADGSGSVAHAALSGVGANDHHAQSHSHASHTGIGADDHHAQAHTLASHSTKPHSALTGIGADDHHAQSHVSRHGVGGADAIAIDYVENTALNQHISHTTEATADIILTSNSKAYDGATAVVVEVFLPYAEAPLSAGHFMQLSLFEDGTPIGVMGRVRTPASTAGNIVPLLLARHFTPSAGNHVYTVGLWGDVTDASAGVQSGAGGANTFMPAFIRIRRA